MSSAELRKGDRIRVTYEGTYDSRMHDDVLLVATSRNTHVVYSDCPDYTIEVLDPEYIPGEVYRDAKGNTYLRLHAPGMAWRPLVMDGSTTRLSWSDVGERYPERPLRKLVPENG